MNESHSVLAYLCPFCYLEAWLIRPQGPPGTSVAAALVLTESEEASALEGLPCLLCKEPSLPQSWSFCHGDCRPL